MSKNIILYFLDDNKQTKKINIEKPNSYEELIKILFEKKYIIYYKSDGEEKNVQNNDEFKKSDNILFIRPKEKEEPSLPKNNNNIPNIAPEDITEDNNKIKQIDKENEKENELIENNKKYMINTFDFFKKILNQIKEIDELIIPNNNNEIKKLKLNNELSSDYIQKNFDDISNIIYKEFENFKQYALKNSNNKLINEDKSNKKEFNKPKIPMNSKTEIKPKPKVKYDSSKISEISKNKIYSCIPRIEIGKPDISHDKLGKE